jgi:hypothetical protein
LANHAAAMPAARVATVAANSLAFVPIVRTPGAVRRTGRRGFRPAAHYRGIFAEWVARDAGRFVA